MGGSCGAVQANSVGGAYFITTINQAPEAPKDHKVYACVAWAKGYAMQLKVGKEVDRPTVGIRPSRVVKYVVHVLRPIMTMQSQPLWGPLPLRRRV